MNTIIEKVRAEVERRIKRNKEEYAPDGLFEVQDNLAKLLSFLSDLEKEEKPIPKDLQEYASRAGFDYVDNIVQEHPCHRFNDHDVEYAYRDGIIAGAKWQKEQDLAEMAQSKSPLSVAYANRCFENGKQAMKEQMMKEALHGWLDEDNEPPYDLNVLCEEKIPFGKFKHRDKVKLIIVKED